MLGFGFNKDKVRAAADKFVQQGKLQNAIVEYDKILKADPKDLGVLNTIGDLYARLGQGDQAVQYFKKVGDSYAAEGFVPKAIAMYKKLTKISPSSYDCIQKLGELYTQQGLYNDARAQFVAAADGYLKNGSPDDAVRILKRILEVDPENAGVQAKLADIFLKQGKRDEAKAILLNAAESMYQRGSLDAADDILGRLLTLDKDNTRAVLMKAQIMLEKGDAKGAAAALEFLPDIDSRPDALKIYMRALIATGKITEAEPIARKLFTVHHDISGITSITEKICVSDPVKGLKYYEEFGDKLIAASSTSVVASLRGIVSKVSDNIGSLELLLKLFQRAGDTSQNAEIYELIAHTSVQTGDLRRAATIYKQLAQLEPENPLHAQNYRQVLTKLGEDPTLIGAPINDAEVPLMGASRGNSEEDWFAPPKATSADAVSDRSFDEMSSEERIAASAASKQFTASSLEGVDMPAAVPPAEFGVNASETPTFDVSPSDTAIPSQQPREFGLVDPEPMVNEFVFGETPTSSKSSGMDFAAVTERMTVEEAPVAPPPPTFEASAVEPAPVEEEHTISHHHEVDLSDEWEQHVAPAPPPPAEFKTPELPLEEPVAAEATPSINDLVEEIKFYLSQAMTQDAASAIQKLGILVPDHEQLSGFRQQLSDLENPQVAAEPVVTEIPLDMQVIDAGETIEVSEAPTVTEFDLGTPAATPAPPPAPEPVPAAAAKSAPTDDILGDLVSDLESSLGDDFAIGGKPLPVPPPPAPAAPMVAAATKPAPAPVAQPAPAPVPAPVGHAGLLDDLFDEFKQDLGDSGQQQEDPDTHYNLGVAFKEMGLLDEAIGELQKVCQAIDHGVPFSQTMQAYTWLANCFVEKGVPEASFMWFERALTVAQDSDSRAAILYELGSAYESANERDKAREAFTKVMSINIDFRDVGERIKALKS